MSQAEGGLPLEGGGLSRAVGRRSEERPCAAPDCEGALPRLWEHPNGLVPPESGGPDGSDDPPIWLGVGGGWSVNWRAALSEGIPLSRAGTMIAVSRHPFPSGLCQSTLSRSRGTLRHRTASASAPPAGATQAMKPYNGKQKRVVAPRLASHGATANLPETNPAEGEPLGHWRQDCLPTLATERVRSSIMRHVLVPFDRCAPPCAGDWLLRP